MDICEIPRWNALKNTLHNLDFNSFVELFNNTKDAICLDVRTASEFHAGHIKGAVNLDYLSKELADELEKLDPNLAYFIYCRTSRRSLRVCVLLRNMGFEKITNLDEGVKDHLNELFLED